MATLGVVHFNTSPNKINVLQQTTNNPERREVLILRKAQQALVQPKDANKQDVLITNTARKRPKSGKEVTRVHNPPPMAVARRNARERNRVKQVNNGFATLRQHIPNSIAAAFESNNGRGGNKKLSKVETLRMAVEYIRSLEDMLDDPSENSESVSTSSISISSIYCHSPASPAFTTKTSMSYTYPLTSPSIDDEDLSTNPTPPPQQYIRINGTNTYQIIPAHLYDDSENLEPIDVGDHLLTDPSLMEADFSGVQDLSLLGNMHTCDSLSPGIYSDDSLSPGTVKSEPQTYSPVFNGQLTPPTENMNVNLRGDVKTEVKSEHPIISLQNESELPLQHKNNMMEVMAWWEQQQTSRS